jgi:2-oxo-4-hydroxy-4-carboxy-5-ureidoimidazoline decarboxylase
MEGARPFDSETELMRLADSEWWALDPEDWLQAFAAHPRIGERDGEEWTAKEQSGMDGAPDLVRRSLEAGNRDYEAKFGHVFLICATGLTGEEMLATLRLRLANDPETELRQAAAEQAKITRLRLEKLT